MINLKKWYNDTYKTDDMKKEINDDLTPELMISKCLSGMDIYKVIGVGDSVIRERLFERVASYFGVSYDEIYDACILGKLSEDLENKIKENDPVKRISQEIANDILESDDTELIEAIKKLRMG